MSFHPGLKSLPELYYEGAGWLKWLTRQVVPRLDAIEASGPSYADFFYAEFGHENVRVVPNPVSDEALPQTLSEYDTREQIVLFVGFLVQRKGVFELLRAAEEVPGARFVMLGRAPTPADMKAFQAAYDACTARDRIDLDIGWKDLHQVYECMERARLLALPSWGETLPLVLGEALLCGLPVVTTPVGVIGDYVQDGVHGCLIEPGDAEALAAAIRGILDDPAWAAEVSARNRVFGRQFLASEVHARRFEIYEQLLD
jgi:glycosyltransferase involved in cell wall biosynthesis